MRSWRDALAVGRTPGRQTSLATHPMLMIDFAERKSGAIIPCRFQASFINPPKVAFAEKPCHFWGKGIAHQIATTTYVSHVSFKWHVHLIEIVSEILFSNFSLPTVAIHFDAHPNSINFSASRALNAAQKQFAALHTCFYVPCPTSSGRQFLTPPRPLLFPSMHQFISSQIIVCPLRPRQSREKPGFTKKNEGGRIKLAELSHVLLGPWKMR